MRAWGTRARGTRRVPTAFLDRDGTLNINRPGTYITRPSQLRLYAQAPAALKIMAAKGYRIVVLTNQSAVARGYMTLAAAKAINLRLVRELQRARARVDAVYMCPHGPQDGCRCRKPATGLLEEAAADLPTDLGRSFLAGDKASDLRMAANGGIKGFLVLTGEWRSAGPAAARGGYKGLLALARSLPDVKERTTT